METVDVRTAGWFRALYLGSAVLLVGGGIAAFVTAGDLTTRWMTLVVLASISARVGFLGVPLGLLVAAVLLHWHGFVTFVAGIATVSGLIQHRTEAWRLRDYRDRLAECEARTDGATI